MAACVTSCGAAQHRATGAGGSLGHAVATVSGATTSPDSITQPSTSGAPADAPEAIHQPARPSARSPEAQAILQDATAFARAYLRYQIGRHPPSVEHALRATCTTAFARLLLGDPAKVPTEQRRNPAYQPAELTSTTYTGRAWLGPGQPTQIVIAGYHTIADPRVGGQLTIHLIRTDGAWRVASLG